MTDLSKFSDVLADFAKDTAKENDGSWMTYKRFQYQVARAHRSNVGFFKMMEETMRPFQWAIERNNFAAIKDVADAAMQVVYAKTILKGIRKVPTKEGEAPEVLEYSPEIGVALFQKLPDLWDEVFKYSNAENNYAPDQIEADAKNS